MANYQKYNRQQAVQLTRHNERQHGDKTEHSNEMIDKARTHLNYNLAPHNVKPMKFIDDRLKEIYVHGNASTVMTSYVLTLPRDFQGNQEDFFKEAYNFFENRVGKENVISAWVHLDESQPHMHFQNVPVVYDDKRNRYKLKGKDFETKKSLKEFHPELQTYLEEKLKVPCNVLNGATDNGNKTINQLKAETLKKENDILQKKIVEQENIIAEKNKIIDSFTPKKKIFGKESDAELIVRNKKIIESEANKRLENVKEKEKNFKEQCKAKVEEINEAIKILKNAEIEINKAEQTLEKAKQEFEKKKQNYETEIKVNAKFYLDTFLKKEQVKLDRSDTLTQDHLRALQSVERELIESISQTSRKGNRSDYER